MKPDNLLKPESKLKKLSPGAKVGIFAPGSPCNPELIAKGVAALGERGFQTLCPEDPSLDYQNYQHGFCSHTPERRAEVFMQLIEDSSVGALFAARGGYGSQHLLELVDFARVGEAGKAIVGYSDVSVILLATYFRSGIPSIHGATVATEFAQESAVARRSVDSVLSLLGDKDYRFKLELPELRSGKGEGPLLAGNLTMLSTLFSTPWDGSYDGSILVLEDVGEAPYRVHRLLTHLRQAGKLDKLAGVVFGRFSGAEVSAGPSIDEVLKNSVKEVFGNSAFPILQGLKFGHHGENLAIPIGCRARIENGTFELLESPL